MKARHYLAEDVEEDHRRLVAARRDELNGTEVSRYSTVSIATRNLY